MTDPTPYPRHPERTSHPEFHARTTNLEVAGAFTDQIKGKTVLVTGVNRQGIGYTTAAGVASGSPALIILAGRSQTKLDESKKALLEAYSTINVETVILDLGSLEAVRRAADEVNRTVSKIDVLINNAGIMAVPERRTSEGFEAHFGTNHLGHFLFTNLILQKLIKAASESAPGSTRVVNVTSSGHMISPFRFSDPNFEGKPLDPEEEAKNDETNPIILDDERIVAKYDPWIAYGSSKTANILFSVALNRKLDKHGIRSFAVHPGGILTELGRDVEEHNMKFFRTPLEPSNLKSQEQGASTSIVAAFDPKIEYAEQIGVYLTDCIPTETHKYANDPVKADKLWALSEDFVKEKFSYQTTAMQMR